MVASKPDTFVTPQWLAARLEQPTVVPVEASFFLPDEGKNGDALFRDGHIPGAARFDVDAVADHAIDLPHMLPDAATFARMVGALGIADTDTIVIYDSTDLLGGARAWWMFEHYGARDVRLLEGGWAAWVASDLPVERGDSRREARQFRAGATTRAVADAEAVLAASRDGRQIVDARAAARFAGSAAEPRPGVRRGCGRRTQRAVARDRGRLRTPARARRDRRRLSQGRHRHRAAGRRELRLGRFRRDPAARVGTARPKRRRALRRVLVRMGQPPRPAAGTRPGNGAVIFRSSP